MCHNYPEGTIKHVIACCDNGFIEIHENSNTDFLNRPFPVYEEKKQFDVVLKSIPLGNTVTAIRLLKNVLKISLSQAKELFDRWPVMIAENVGKEEAEKIKNEFEKIGVIIEIK